MRWPAQESAYEEDGVTHYTYGHTLIVELWGPVVVRRVLSDGLVRATLDLDDVALVRDRIQVAEHRQQRPSKDLP